MEKKKKPPQKTGEGQGPFEDETQAANSKTRNSSEGHVLVVKSLLIDQILSQNQVEPPKERTNDSRRVSGQETQVCATDQLAV